MAIVRVLVLRAAGINCDEETEFAWKLAGARANSMHVNRLIENPLLLSEYQIITVPGGFSYGDDIAAGKILGVHLARHLGEAVRSFVERGGLVLGICNGFQILVRAGLLPGVGCDVPVTLTRNDSGRYEARWVTVRSESTHCAFLNRGEMLEIPVAHAEGKFTVAEASHLTMLEKQDRVALRYVCPSGGPPVFPENPNGSIGNVAGLTDATGRVLGLMPHPERSVVRTQHPAWSRDSSIESAGLRLFRRAVSRF
ncbi:MAG: phosphoribosylformylglycinamidine synthase I [Planctomycetota bacterium]|nr:phosphoribosylformylglycinamidine synthase I [Planctomycetota bacterium]